MLSVLRHTGVSFGRATKITVFNYRHNPIQLIHATNRLYDEKVNVKSTRATDNEPEAERVSHNAAAGGAQVIGAKAKDNLFVFSNAAMHSIKRVVENPEVKAAVKKTLDVANEYADKTKTVAAGYAAKTKDTVSAEYKEFVANLESMNLQEMKRQVLASPREYFMYGTLAVSPVLVPAMSFLSAWQHYPSLATVQLIWSGVLVTYFAGMRFGLSLVDVGFPDKQTSLHCGLPIALCWGSMVMPTPVAYVGAMGGLFSTAYFDHISTVYPETFHAIRVFFTLVAIGALAVGFMSSVTLLPRVQASVGQHEDKL